MTEPPSPLLLADYVPNGQVGLSDGQRWPGLSRPGQRELDRLANHPDAPAWVHRTGHRLTPAEQEASRSQQPLDGWLDDHLVHARSLPLYRHYPHPLERLEDFPLISRQDLVDDVAAFVPLDADLERMLHGSSSGSTGSALTIPDDPQELARGFHWLRGLVGDQWQPDTRRLAVAQVVYQRQAFTYASVVPGFGEALMVRLNLHPDVWPRAARNRFLIDRDPQVISGNPTSLEQLLDPDLVSGLRPLALVSGAMALSQALLEDLRVAYDCPVIDIYGLHETRPIAVRVDGGPFVIVKRRVHVEVLAPPGEVGEIVVTAGENAFLPLVRYRTGDTGRLVDVEGRPAIADLEGREATVFEAADGTAIPCVELTQLLQSAGAHGWSVRQDADGTAHATVAGGDETRIRDGLRLLLGRRVPVEVVQTLADLGEGKPRRYRRTTERRSPSCAERR